MSASVVSGSPTPEPIPAGTWHVDPNRSAAKFQVKHIVIATVKGRVGVFAGVLETRQDAGLGAHGTVQVASVDTHGRQRAEHRRLADFTDAVADPQIRFASREITPVGGTSLRISGELTTNRPVWPAAPVAEASNVRVAPWATERTELVVRGALSREDFERTGKKRLDAGGRRVSDRLTVGADMKLGWRVRSAWMADMSSLASTGATVYRGSRADATPEQRMAKRWATEPARRAAPTAADGGAEG